LIDYRLSCNVNIFINSRNLLILLRNVSAILLNTLCVPLISIFYEIFFSLWRTRNCHHCDQTSRIFIPSMVAHTACIYDMAIATYSNGNKKAKRMDSWHIWLNIIILARLILWSWPYFIDCTTKGSNATCSIYIKYFTSIESS
jgi:hypothetical protein